MIFRKISTLNAKANNSQNIICITDNNWDDYFKYETAFNLSFLDSKGKVWEIGLVKIALKEQNIRRAKLPNSFTNLDKTFFSLGQSDDYYENIKIIDQRNLGFKEKYFKALNDIAFDLSLYEEVKGYDVTRLSIMRDISNNTIINQFHRIAKGGARLTNYKFGFIMPSLYSTNKGTYRIDNPNSIFFKVIPGSTPPTNIHAVIGRNSAGKTTFIKNMINAALNKDNNSDKEYGYFYRIRLKDDKIARMYPSDIFANVICVAFSAFDDFPSSNEVPKDIDDTFIPYKFIGLDYTESENIIGSQSNRLINILAKQFSDSLHYCFKDISRKKMWKNAMIDLSCDPHLESFVNESGIIEVDTIDNKDEFLDKAQLFFKILSSGHKIILLTITRLIEHVREKSFIILDEPETHLHPPLLANFIRTLSDILIEKNAVAIITTHSPIVLQEIPSSCAWKIFRTGYNISINELENETFGTNINELMREVFELDNDKSGYKQLLVNIAKNCNYDYEAILDTFKHNIGDDARTILKTIIALHEVDKENA